LQSTLWGRVYFESDPDANWLKILKEVESLGNKVMTGDILIE
jgi:hypothetical protein